MLLQLNEDDVTQPSRYGKQDVASALRNTTGERETEPKGKRIRAGTKADVSNVVATVAGDCTNDAPAQRAASAAAAAAAAAVAAIAD